MDGFKNEISSLNEAGTPQGGIISPLLCNVALHGMETLLLKNFRRDGVKIIRYADDFLVMGRDLEDIKKAKRIVVDFLQTVDLELSEEKTRIGHSMHKMNEGSKAGVDFLGYHFRNYLTSKHRGVKSTHGVKQTFKQVSMPSKDSVKSHKEDIKDILKKYKNAPRKAILARLSANIQGWTQYHAVTQCSRYFSYLDK